MGVYALTQDFSRQEDLRTTTADSLQREVMRAQRGDVASFNRLVRAHQTLMYHTAYRLLGDGESAADATQDALISAFKNLKSFRGGSFKAWLMRILVNYCYDQLRSKKRKPAVSLDMLLEDPNNLPSRFVEAHQESPHESAERQELDGFIQKGLAQLSPEQRATLILADIEGFDYEQVASMTNTNSGTVKSRLSRARAQLREFLLAQQELLPDSYRAKNAARTHTNV